MTNEQINIAIAKLQGWTKINEVDRGCGIHPEFTDSKDYLGRPMKNPPTWEIPDYCNDLNAMHEAEKLLNKKGAERRIYIAMIYKLVGYHSYDVCHATAAQRAEAFLKTIGKWED